MIVHHATQMSGSMCGWRAMNIAVKFSILSAAMMLSQSKIDKFINK
jgi:hypothetical protein